MGNITCIERKGKKNKQDYLNKKDYVMPNDLCEQLCEELIVEIFLRLPPKSLLRFRSVSKSLCALIDSPGFIRLHTVLSPKKIMFMHQKRGEDGLFKHAYAFHSEGQLPYYNTYTDIAAFKDPPMGDEFLGSSDGILSFYGYGKGVTLWNPSIRRKVSIPECRSWYKYHVACGFGFDPIIDDYKIVRILRSTSFVCSMKKQTWRKIASPNVSYSSLNSHQCLFNGALHWVERRYLPVAFEVGDYYFDIITFDLSSEVFSMIELPEPRWRTTGVTVIKGSLSVISSKQDDCRIWVRNNTDVSWSVAFKFNLYLSFNRVTNFLHLTANDDLLINMYGREIMIYNNLPADHQRTNCMTVISSLFNRVNNFFNPKKQVQSRIKNLNDSSHIVEMHHCIESFGLLDIGTLCD